MMIISSGYGYFTGVIGFICLMLTQILTDGIVRDHHYYENHGWPKLMALWMAAAIVWPLGRSLNQQKQKYYFDPWHWVESIVSFEDNKPVHHAFFFIPMEYWALIFSRLGIIFLFAT